jgi:magnesium transporter
MSNALFGPEIRGLLLDDDADGLAAVCDTLHPATLSEALDEEAFTDEDVWRVITPSDVRTQAAIFEYLPPARQESMVEAGDLRQVGKLLGKMSHDDRVDLLQRLPDRVKDNLLRAVDEADRRDIATLFTYEPGTVGSLMTTDYAWLPPTLTAAEAIDQLRTQAPDRETIYYIYVLAEAARRADGGVAPRRLLGVITLRDLILAPRHALVGDLMETEVVALKLSDSQEEAADLLGRYDFLAVPVLDDAGGVVGIVTHDDILDVMREAATEDLHRQAGVGPLPGAYLEASFARLWYSRVGWLGVLFLAQMITIEVMTHYEDKLRLIAALGVFIPLCLSVGGNAGAQASTLVTRALALGEIETGDWLKVIRREVFMGLALGAAIGILGFLRTRFLTPAPILANNPDPNFLTDLTWVIALTVAGICLWGTLLGAALPMLFQRLGLDPALMSSPFIATISDVSGIVIYFNVAAFFFF